MDSFSDTGLDPALLDAVKELGFVKPTPIQVKTIPLLLSSDQDVIAFAQTGTGKTAAFGLPAIHLTNVQDKSTQTLVLCPTRELCMQIANDLITFSKYVKGMRIIAVYGGSSIDTQIRALKRGAHIVVGTPGRTKDLIKRKRLILDYVERVVLDEADEMLTMGFKDDLDAILAKTPPGKQTLMFSATKSREMTAITKKNMRDPVEISVARLNKGADNVRHMYYMVQARDRYEVLKRIVDINPNIYGIVFCRTRRETKEIANKLMHDDYNADALHGDLSQAQRDEVMGRFRNRQLQLLIATDVAARGLDVNDLTHIINFNLPDDPEGYTHRSGRTGRAGKSGISIAIIHTRESRRIKEIERSSGVVFSKERVPSGKDICTKQLYALIDKIEKVHVDELQIAPFLSTIYDKLGWLSKEELIKHFISAEFNRFLAYYKNARDLNVPDFPQRERRGPREKQSASERRKTPYSRLFINLGTKNSLTPTRLIGLINQSLRSGSTQIGKIEVLKKFSFFEVEKSKEGQLVEAMNQQNFQGVEVFVETSQVNAEFASYPKIKASKQRDFVRKGRKGGGKKRRDGGGGRGKRRKD